ncbi:MAG: invasion associated locus B family protein [Proteobacteria bacterium]|nr:invasion associated locus B family protein [Pseudomonadota bacterium]
MLRGTRILPVILLAMIALQVQAAETRRENFGDWGFICSKAEGQENAKESCNLFQTALLNNEQAGGEAGGSESGGQRVLLTRVGFLEGNENPVLLITAPLGILLPMKITVEVEGHETISIPVQRCDAGGCLAYVVMEEPFIEAFRKAAEAKVTFYDMQRRGVTIPLSLKGFTKGIETLVDSRD